MADPITTNPQRSEPLVDKEGMGNDQLIEWFDDIELRLNALDTLQSFTVTQLSVIVPPATRPQVPATDFLNGVVIVSDETGGRTLATSDGINWKRVSDGNNIS